MVVIEDSEQSLILFDAFANLKQNEIPPGLLTQRSFSQMTFSWNWQPSYKIKQDANGLHCSPEKTLPLLVFNHLNIFILKRKILTSSDCKRLYLKSISLVWTNLCLQYVRQLDRLSQFKQYIFTRFFVISPIYSDAEYLHNWFLSVNLNELKSIK